MNTVIFSNYDDCFKASAVLLEGNKITTIYENDFDGSPYYIFETYDGFQLFDYFMKLFGVTSNIRRIVLIENARVTKIRIIKFKEDGLIQVVDEKENIIEE